ncbi:MAG: hypothetical protein H6R13_1603 [Proteobacteria bacterium]|nr:hypothetical protein [Pseudomonadota bacterium]
MRYTFLSAHSVQGIVHQDVEADLVLFDDRSQGIRVVLTGNANAHLRLLNRALALLSLMLRGKIGDPLTPDFTERLAEETAKVERQRLDAIGTCPVVVIEVEGDVDASLPTNARLIQDFFLCFDAFDKKALRDQLLTKVSAVLTAIRIGADNQYEFRPLADGSYLTTNDGQVVHSASLEGGSAELYVSSKLTEAQRTRVAIDILLVLTARGLERVISLHAQSLNKMTDNYRSFIASWAALEILIGKLFPRYQGLLTTELRAINQAPGLHAYLDRVAAVMGDKHNLADKFSVLSVYLDDERRTDELNLFRSLKKIRDRLSHGEDIAEASLPTREVQRLFEKYLRNHLRRNG